ncbi:hypothetical protein B0T10DRAFT_407267 [Thelonectria olida]|uniref:Uncharacterized protein n=1 Tax=Thelonectria olida TaxID=1576542 RepID=A0A9P9ANR2_9HYPO|nr:hypothetical protein B0T10DRAFT_407267 [Thelonectria olida]
MAFIKATSSSLLLLAWLSAHVAAEDVVYDIDEVCQGVSGVIGCTTDIVYPTGARAVLCELVYDVQASVLDGFIKTEYVSDASICLYDDEALTFTDDKSKVVREQLAPKDGWTVLRSAEVDLVMYRKLVAASWACAYNTDFCNKRKLRNFFVSYFEASDGVTNGELVRMLKGWVTLFDSIQKKIDAVNKASKTVQSRLKSVSSKISGVRKNVCVKNACKGKTAIAYLTKISKALDSVKKLNNIPDGVSKASKATPKILQATKKAITSATTPGSEDYYFKLFSGTGINAVKDLPKAFEVTSYLPAVAKDLKNAIIPIVALTKHQSRAQGVVSQLNGLLTQNWIKNKDFAKTKEYRKVRDGFISIQKVVKGEMRGPVTDLAKAIKSLDDALSKFPLRKKKLEMKYGAAQYARYCHQDFKAPCSKEVTQEFEINGFYDSFTYNQLYQCQFGPKTISFPHHHLPWIRYRFV